MNRDVHLDEAVVEAEAVPDGVLPALLRLPVERKLVLDELVDLAQSAHLERRRLHAATAHIHTYARTNMRTVWSKRTLAAGSRSADVPLLFCCMLLLRCCSIAAAAAAGQTDKQTRTMLYAKCAVDAAGVRRK